MTIAIPLLDFDGKKIKNLPLMHEINKKIKFIIKEFKDNNLNFQPYEDHFLV